MTTKIAQGLNPRSRRLRQVPCRCNFDNLIGVGTVHLGAAEKAEQQVPPNQERQHGDGQGDHNLADQILFTLHQQLPNLLADFCSCLISSFNSSGTQRKKICLAWRG